MDCCCMGVGTDMFRRESADLVAALRAIPGKAESAPGETSAGDSSEPCDPATGGGAWWEERRALKHERQYTGRFLLGLKGTVVGVAHSAQTTWRPGLRLCRPGRTDGDFDGMRKRTPYGPRGEIGIEGGDNYERWEGGRLAAVDAARTLFGRAIATLTENRVADLQFSPWPPAGFGRRAHRDTGPALPQPA